MSDMEFRKIYKVKLIRAFNVICTETFKALRHERKSLLQTVSCNGLKFVLRIKAVQEK